MKRDGNYRMSKPLKRMLATIQDKNERAKFKELAIQAEMSYVSNDWVILKGPNDKNDKE